MAGAAEDAEARLQAAVHYSTGEIVSAALLEEQPRLSRAAVAVLARLVEQQAQSLAADLEAFARHGKRSTVNVEDVKWVGARGWGRRAAGSGAGRSGWPRGGARG